MLERRNYTSVEVREIDSAQKVERWSLTTGQPWKLISDILKCFLWAECLLRIKTNFIDT